MVQAVLFSVVNLSCDFQQHPENQPQCDEPEKVSHIHECEYSGQLNCIRHDKFKGIENKENVFHPFEQSGFVIIVFHLIASLSTVLFKLFALNSAVSRAALTASGSASAADQRILIQEAAPENTA